MFQGQCEAGAPEAEETNTPDSLAGISKNAKSPPVTWRHRHRRQPKDKTPITKKAAYESVACLRRKYQALLDSGRLIEGTNHIRLLGDLAQQLSDLIERICDVKPEELREAAQRMRRESKKAFGSLRLIEAGLSAPVPDHVSKWDGGSLRSAKVHYDALQNVCGQFEKIVGRLSHDQRQGSKVKAGYANRKTNGITYLPPNPHGWRLPPGTMPEEQPRTIRTEVFQRFLDLLPEQNSYNPNWRRS
jgi:hypothetical protein